MLFKFLTSRFFWHVLIGRFCE